MTDTTQEAPPSYPQPHEGVTAQARPDDVICESTQARLLIGTLGYKLWKARLFGGSGHYTEFNKMQDLAEGDLVFVIDAFRKGYSDEHQAAAVGYFLGVRTEWADTDKEWEATQQQYKTDPEYADLELGPRHIEERAFYIQYGQASICRWVNCDVAKAV